MSCESWFTTQMAPSGALASVRGCCPTGTSNSLALVLTLMAATVLRSGFTVQARLLSTTMVLDRLGLAEVSGRWMSWVTEQLLELPVPETMLR